MEDIIEFYIELTTPYGTYEGEVFRGKQAHYDGMIEMAKAMYDQEVFETYLRDGSFLVLNREIIKQSIIIVKIKED